MHRDHVKKGLAPGGPHPTAAQRIYPYRCRQKSEVPAGGRSARDPHLEHETHTLTKNVESMNGSTVREDSTDLDEIENEN